jgi:hypothetical protein
MIIICPGCGIGFQAAAEPPRNTLVTCDNCGSSFNYVRDLHAIFSSLPSVPRERTPVEEMLMKSPMPAEAGGVRHDGGKERFDLIPPDALMEVLKAYTLGEEKYPKRNWEKGMAWGRVFAAMMRHAWKFWRGERHDPEDGMHHLAAVVFGAMTLLAYDLRGVGEDDRTKC